MPKTYSQTDLRKDLHEMVRRSSQKAVAEKLGFSSQTIGDVLVGRMDISERIAQAMGYEREIIFRKRAA